MGRLYIEEPYYTEKCTLDLRSPENCLTCTRDIDHVYTLAANMGGIGFITALRLRNKVQALMTSRGQLDNQS